MMAKTTSNSTSVNPRLRGDEIRANRTEQIWEPIGVSSKPKREVNRDGRNAIRSSAGELWLAEGRSARLRLTTPIACYELRNLSQLRINLK